MFVCRETGIRVTVLLVLVILPILAQCADPPDAVHSEPMQARVAELIKNLNADRRLERIKARRELIDLGPPILPLLPPLERLSNASVREAVRAIRLRLEKTQARNSIKPAEVTVAEGMSLRELIDSISRQSGNRIDVTDLSARVLNSPIKIDETKRTFWEMMDSLARQGRFRYAENPRAGMLKLEEFIPELKADEIPLQHDGAFRVAVRSAVLRPLLGDQPDQLLRLELRIVAEPRLRPLFLKYDAREITARDEASRVYEPYNPEASYELPLGQGGRRVDVRADFRVPNRINMKQIDLGGRVVMQTAAGAETFRFDKLEKAKGRARRLGGVTTTLRKVAFHQDEQGSSTADIGISVAYDVGGRAFESHRTWIFHNEAYLETSDGRRIEREGDFKTLRQADGAVAVEYRFKNLTDMPEEYRFVYIAPTLIINVPISLEIARIIVSRSTDERTPP